MKSGNYIQAIGRRKTAVALVRFWAEGNKEIIINGKNAEDYFDTLFQLQNVSAPLRLIQELKNYRIMARVKGGGKNAQSEALRLGIARALVTLNASYKQALKEAGFLKRDPREKERKKFGLKRARRAPQWQKR